MDSLLATYASSDEEEVEEEQSHHQQKQPPSLSSDLHPNPKSSALSSLPPPKSTFLSLPPPKSQTLKPSSLFSVLPQPNAQNPNPQIPSNPKKVVQFKPPINPSIIKSLNSDDEEDEEDEKEKQKKKAKTLESMNAMPTVKSFLSNIPAPKNSMTLGALPSSSGSGRKSILEASSNSVNSNTSRPSLELDKSVDDASSWNSVSENNVNYCDNAAIDASNLGSVSEGYANYNSSGVSGAGFSGASNLGSASENYANYGSYDVGYAEYGNSYEYESKWIDRSSGTTEMPIAPAAESVMRGSGKRGRNDVVPQDIIEVKQDELMKNRPREDQSKLTGIAFGPSYQPVSTKGKPSKLHKRKHQIGTLYFDMKNKDMELSERRARGFLTKAETQAKYGW